MTTPVPAKPLIAALRGEKTSAPPIWLMRQAGRYLPEYRETRSRADGFLDFCYTPDLAIEATLQPIRRFALDAAIVFSDILVIPDALGQDVSFVEGKGPVLVPLKHPSDVSQLSLSRVSERLDPVYRTIRAVRGELPPGIALIGFAGAPWTLASYMVEGGSSRDFARLKCWAYGDPDGMTRLVEILVEAVSDHLMAQIAAGADAVQLFDSWAGVLPEDGVVKWCAAPARQIVDRVKDVYPDIPFIAFPKGIGVLYGSYAEETGVDAVSIDTTVPLDWARVMLQGRAAVQGNLDPVSLLVGGAQLTTAARRICAALAAGRFVFNLGHGVLPETPPDHVRQLVEVVRSIRS